MHAATSAVIHVAASLALQANAGNRIAAQHLHRVGQEMELHAFLFSGGNFLQVRGHVDLFASVDDMHFSRAQTPGGTRHINGNISAADDGNALTCQIRGLSQGNFAQDVDAVIDALFFLARNTQAGGSCARPTP